MSVERSELNVERSGAAGRAVFLSYASQDAEAAKRIAEALRAAGVEVWFDQSELRGGDAWDAMIRKRIKECALFVPVITPNTNARAEGYFRLEWKLAVDRSHLMADDAPFLFPVVLGDVTDASARVPDKFREVQWTRLRLDETPGELAARVARLLSGNVGSPLAATSAARSSQATTLQRSRWHWWMIFPVIGTIMGLMFAAVPLWKAFQGPPSKRAHGVTPDPKPQTPDPKPSEARQLAGKARALIDAIDSTADDFAAAESLIKRALELDATDGEVWAVSSRINSSFLSRGFERSATRRETARSQAERAVKLAPNLPEAWLALGRGIGMTDAVRAEEALRHGLGLAPENGRLLLGLASIYRQSNRFDEALAIYERAAAQPETRALARYDQYLIHFYSRRFAEADRCLRESISVSKSSIMVAGLALLDVTWRGDVAQAQRVLADTSAALRGQTRVVLAGVLVNLMAGQPDEALQAFDRLPADYVNDAWYTGPKALLVGLAHFQAGRQEAARIAWESGLAVVRRRLQEAPNDLELHLRLGELLAWTGQTEMALQEARIFNELQRGRATDWTYSSVRIHAALGRVDDALPLLEQLLAAPSSNRWPLTPALLRIDPLWSKLRGDPRFQKLCEERPEKSAAAPVRPVSALVLQGREMLEKYTTDDTQRETLTLAEELAKKAVQADVTDADAWSLQAQIHSVYITTARDRAPARFAEVAAAAEKAMQLAPQSDEALLARAIAYRRRIATRPEAERILRDLAQRHPGDRRVLRALGNTLRLRRMNEDALAVFRQSAALPGGDARAELFCAEMLKDLGRLDEAAAAADRSFAVQPTGSVRLFKVNLARLRGDLPLARAELAKMPPTVLLDDRGAVVAANVWLWSREPEKAIAALEAIPGDDLYNTFFNGPKSLILGFAHELAGRNEVAKVQWRIASKNLDDRAAADPSMMVDPLYLGTKMFLDFLIDDPDKRAGARQMLRVYMQMGVTVDMDPAWDPAKLFTLLGRQDVMIDLADIILQSGEMPNLRQELRTDKRYDPLRGNPRFEALLVEPKK